MSKVEVDKVIPQSGTTLTIGDSGDTINLVGTLQSNGSPLPGDISSVVAGTGLSGGGTTGAVTLNIEAAQPTITSLGTLTGLTTTGNINLGDNDKAIFGTGNDLEIYHDGSNSIISDTGTGSLKLLSGAAFYIRTPADASMIEAFNGGAVDLFYNGSKKFETTSAGATITGTATVTGGLTVDTDTLFVDSSNNRVGVGTSSPGFDLVVKDASGACTIRAENGADNKIVDLIADSTGGLLRTIGSYPLVLNTNQTERARIDASGNFGIGETAPLGLLHVKTGESSSSVHASANELVVEGSANAGISILTGNSNEGAIYFGDDGNNDVGRIRYLHNTNQMDFTTNGGIRASITSAGNFGIGTTSPSEKLEVNGTVKATSFDGAGRVLQVIQTVKTDAFTTTSTSMTDITGFSVSITPSSSSNKILVIVNVAMLANNGAYGTLINLLRGSTNLTSSSAGGGADTNNAWNVGGGGGMTNNERKYSSPSISFLDSPSSTSSLTYKCQLMVNGGSTTGYFNRWGLNTDHAGVSTITVMEIQG